MQISDLPGEGPLAQFNATLATKDDILKLVKSINDNIDTTKEKKLDIPNLEKIFYALWSDLENKIIEAQTLLTKKPAKTAIKPRRQMEDLLEELIELSRSNSIILNELPARLTPLVTPLKDIGRTRFSFRDIAKETSNKNRYIQLKEEIKYLVKAINTHEAQLISPGDAIDLDLRDTLVKDLAQLQKKLYSKMKEIGSLEERLNSIGDLAVHSAE